MPEATHCRNPAALSPSLSLRDLIAFTSLARGRFDAGSVSPARRSALYDPIHRNHVIVYGRKNSSSSGNNCRGTLVTPPCGHPERRDTYHSGASQCLHDGRFRRFGRDFGFYDLYGGSPYAYGCDPYDYNYYGCSY
jgi:hypothetical protein